MSKLSVKTKTPWGEEFVLEGKSLIFTTNIDCKLINLDGKSTYLNIEELEKITIKEDE